MLKFTTLFQISAIFVFSLFSVKSQTSKNEDNTQNIFQQSAKLFPADPTAFTQFGRSVAISGDTAIVGSIRDYVNGNPFQGSAYIFVKTEVGWVQQQKLVASDGTKVDYFGNSVAIYGNTAVVGAYTHEVGPNKGQGTVYVFERNGTTWTEKQKLIATDGQTSDAFGVSVAISLDTIIIGASGHEVVSNLNQGTAYIFVRNGDVWHQQQKLLAFDGAEGDSFGEQVSISGNLAIVGAGLDDLNGNSNQGSAYVFVRNGNVWTTQQQITAPDGGSGDLFGSRVGIFGETVVVGAYSDNINSNLNQGSAYIFNRESGVWAMQQKLTADDGAARDNFGISVNISGNTVAVGAYVDDVGPNEDQGSVYIFRRSGNVWAQEKVLSTDGALGDWFGGSVALSKNHLIVGAELVDFNPTLEPGAAYIFQDPLLLQSVGIQGRVLSSSGRGSGIALVSLVKENGEILTRKTNSFGYYQFKDIEIGQTVKIEVKSKQFNYSPKIVGVAGEITNLNFLPE